jgi:hypothetical protein
MVAILTVWAAPAAAQAKGSAEAMNEKAAAEAAAKGLPPPERVFERVNGPDRGR